MGGWRKRWPGVYLDNAQVIRGDALEVLRDLEDGCVHCVVTDPPYDLTSGKKGGTGPASLNLNSPAGRSRITTGFMGLKWDGTGIAFTVELWAEVLRVLKPGGHMVVFGGTRTFHRLTCAVEDAGFEIRDCLMWLYSTGFPKSLDVGKAIDKAAGAEREVIGPNKFAGVNGKANKDVYGVASRPDATAPATDDAARWEGWGTALKPAWEPIVLARKPLNGTVAGNVLANGTGGINVDACRISARPTAKVVSAWEQGENLCTSCAEGVDKNPKPAVQANAGSTVPKPVEPMMNGKAGAHHGAISRADIGCSPGLNLEEQRRSPSEDSSSSIVASGKMPTDQSLKAASFITSTGTNSTTASKTCNSCGAVITPPITTKESPSGNGRWPSNVILSHLEGCEQVGVRKIKGTVNVRRNIQDGGEPTPDIPFKANHQRGADFTHAGPDGTETMPVYECQPGCPVTELDRQSGQSNGRAPGSRPRRGRRADDDVMGGGRSGFTADTGPEYSDSGGASRFFYCTKAGKKERPKVDGVNHPTVKPLALMRWLVRLVCPPEGIVLDPFAGSGTTLEACVLEGFRGIGVEREPEYIPLIEARLHRVTDLT